MPLVLKGRPSFSRSSSLSRWACVEGNRRRSGRPLRKGRGLREEEDPSQSPDLPNVPARSPPSAEGLLPSASSGLGASRPLILLFWT